LNDVVDRLLERIAALESDLKRLKNPGFVVTGGLRVVDRAGTVRASLEVTEEDCCQLLFHAPRGDMRVQLEVTAEGTSALRFVDANGRMRLQLALDDERPSICLVDENGVLRLQASFANWKSPELMLLDGTAEPRARLGVLPDGTGYVVAHNEANRG
jgi:hypothetical protein